MAASINSPPVLSTPETRILSETSGPDVSHGGQRLSDEEIYIKYEIQRTLEEINKNKWKRLALQFPDDMLRDSTSVYQLLAKGLNSKTRKSRSDMPFEKMPSLNDSKTLAEDMASLALDESDSPVRLTILADTSYGSCCVDEIAAEHVNADAVVHYGRACLSPTSRLPVLHIYTMAELDLNRAIETFKLAYPEKDQQVIITADVPYANHIPDLYAQLSQIGYSKLFAAAIIHNPSSLIPNRTIPESVQADPTSLKRWHLFHISEPPTSLLLALASRVAGIRVLTTGDLTAQSTPKSLDTSTSMLLRRRYALITSLSTVAVWGILINTLSVRNFIQMVEHVKSQIAKAGKKSYMFVIGKLNAAKVANFSEIGGWVVIGCWESSLIDSKDFYKPVITPFELDLALRSDNERVWTGDWRSDFQGTFEAASKASEEDIAKKSRTSDGEEATEELKDFDSEEDSEPPEYDLRTGRYVSRTRPMQYKSQPLPQEELSNDPESSKALTRRQKWDVLNANGLASPAAEFLAQKRNWRGLGSDFEISYESEEQGALVEEGLTGIPRAYAIGEFKKS